MTVATENGVTIMPREITLADRTVTLRRPTIADGPAVWRLVEETPGLDSNSSYYYTIWFRDFAECSLVATVDEEIIGFLTGYRRPEEPDTYFAWQTATRTRHGIPFLGLKIFEHVADEQVARGARYLEATVSAENTAIIMILKKLARKYGVGYTTEPLFGADLLPGADGSPAHHAEVLYRIGPLPRH